MPSAERVNWAKFRVFAVSIAGSAILLTLFYLLTGGTLLQPKVTLYVYIPDATGVGPGSPVRVDGIGVGKVVSVRLSGSNEPNRVVKVTLSVERRALRQIPADSYAQISAETLVGDKYVDVSSGTSRASIRPGGEIRYEAQPELLKSLDLSQFDRSLRTMDSVLTDIEQGRNRVGQFIIGEQMYDDLRRRIAEVQRGMLKATSVTTEVGRLIYTDALYRKISQPLVDLDRALARLQSGQGGAGRFLEDPAQYEQLRSAAAKLRSSIANLASKDFLVSDSAYSSWSGAAASLIGRVDEFNRSPLFSSSIVYDNLNGAASELRDTVRDFRQNPKKYLRTKLF